jgi:autotransporter-associated beta strand protein
MDARGACCRLVFQVRRERRWPLLFAALGLTAILTGGSGPAQAATCSWTAVSSSDWSLPGSWSGGSPPTSNDDAWIVNGGTVTVSSPGDVCNTLSLGSTAGSGTVQMNGGTNFITNALYLGYDAGSTGAYSVIGTGQLSASIEYVGYSGTGNFTQSSGINSVGSSFNLGYGGSGSYILSGNSQLSASYEILSTAGGTGNFTQSGGTNTVSDLFLAYDSVGSGTYTLNGPGLLSVTGDEYVGYYATGVFTQSAGSTAVTGNLYLGRYSSGNGSYTLNGGGSLSASCGYVGYSGTGNFTQSGGTNAILNDLYLGYNSSGNGTYTLSETGSLSAVNEYIANSGSGTFTQSGGTNSVNGSLILANSSGSNGTYYLTGGTLSVSQIVQGAGNAAFNFGGGVLRASAPLSTALSMTLTGSGGNATVDTNGYAVALSGGLSGAGGLIVQGTGTLVLRGGNGNTYGGGTTLLGGSIDFNAAGLGSGAVEVNPTGGTAWLIWGHDNGTSNTTDLTAQTNGLTLVAGTAGFDLQGQTVTFGSSPIAGSGSLSIANGTLVLGNNSGLGTGPVALVNSVNGNATGTGFLSFNCSGSTTVANTISGVGGLIQSGGTLTLTASNTYSGGTSVVNGLLLAENAGAIPKASLLEIGAGGSLVLGNPLYRELGLLLGGGPAGPLDSQAPDDPQAGTPVQAVPEPGTLALLVGGALGLLGWAWRRSFAG